MQEHRIPAMLVAGGIFEAVADPAVARMTAFVRNFAEPEFLAELRARGYPVTDEAACAFSEAMVYPSVDEMLAAQRDLLGLVSAVPTADHDKVAIRAMRAGLDVCSDKPTAAGPERASEMLRVACAEERVLQVGYHWPVQLRRVRDLLQSGVVERLDGGAMSWTRQAGIPGPKHFWENPSTGGVTRDVTGHKIAGLTSLVGQAPIRVRAWGSREAGLAIHGPKFKAEDTVGAELQFGDGQLWSDFSSWATGLPPNERAGIRAECYPEDTWVDAPVIVQKSAEYQPDPGAFRPTIRHAGASDPCWLGGDGMTYVEAMIAQAAEFRGACEQGTPLALPVELAVAVEFVVDAILRSAGPCDGRWGPWVDVERVVAP
jgi:predicted dehydrogenase